MVSSEDSDSVSESNLESNKKSDSLYGVISAIHIISHEKIICLGNISTNSKKFLEIEELSMDVSTDCDGNSDLLDVGFVSKDCLSLIES